MGASQEIRTFLPITLHLKDLIITYQRNEIQNIISQFQFKE
jgi:hypothetical protein